MLTQKLGAPSNISNKESNKISNQISVDRVREVLATCYRRAVFARMHAQISIEAMFDSLADCRVTLQKLIVFVEPEELQQLVASIIGELDFIETLKHEKEFSEMKEINASKLRIIAALLQLGKDAGVSFTLPTSITEEAFFTKEEAEMPPSDYLSPPYAL